MKLYSLSTSLMLTLASSVAMADTWTYADCVGYAREHNISLRKSRLNQETSAYNLEEAKAQWQPTLDFATSHNYSNYPWSEGTKNFYNSSYGLNAGWTVWNGGERENTIKRSELQTRIDRLTTDDMLRTIETDLLQVYVNLLYTRESINIYEEAARVSEVQADRGRQLMEAGRMSRVDYAQLQSQAEQDRYAVVNAQSTYDTRRMELKQLLELGLETQLSPADVSWDKEAVMAELPPMTESYDMARRIDLQLQSLDLEKDAAELDVAIAKAGRSPRLSLNAGVGTTYNAPGSAFGSSLKRNWNEGIGLTLAIPILDNKKTKTAVARAKVQQMDADLDIDQRQTQLAQDVENWYIQTRSAQARFTAAEQQLESARLTDELTNEQFRLGYINTVELMTAHNAYIEAQHTLLQSKYMAMLGQKMIEYYRTATVNLP